MWFVVTLPSPFTHPPLTTSLRTLYPFPTPAFPRLTTLPPGSPTKDPRLAKVTKRRRQSWADQRFRRSTPTSAYDIGYRRGLAVPAAG